MIGYVATSNRVAQAGIDYTFSKAVVYWPEYAYYDPRSIGYIGPRYFQVPITDNTLLDGNRLLDLLLVEPTGSITLGGEFIPLGGARSRMRTPMSIVDNDFDKGVLTFSSPTYTVNENQAFINVTVVRTNGTDGQVGVSYFTTDGSALAGGDYTGKSDTLEFKPGTATAVIQIPIFNDTQVELDETFKIVLTNATGGAKLPGGTEVSFDLATVSILDDDFAPGRLSFLTTNFNVMENSGVGTVTVIRNGGNYGSISVDVSATSGTAIAGTDFTAVTTRLQWNSGDTTPKTFSVPLINNNIVDGARTVNLQLSNASTNGALGNRPTATLTIVDDDSFGALSFSQPVYEANENGTNLLVTVVRSGGLAGQVSVDYMVTGGSAVGGQDYNLVPGTLTMVPGQSSATFSIQLLDNAVSDGVRTIEMSLGNILSATNGNFLTTTVLILDNETANEPAGSLDTAFDTGLGANKPVYALALQPDGKLIAGGDFTTLNGVTRHRLGRVLPNGSLDATYNVGQGPNRPVRALALQPDNKLVIAGFFTLVHGTNRNHIARLHEDGTLDAAFDPGSGGDNPIYAVALKNSGKVVVGGSFTTFNGLTRPNIVVLNTNGSVDLSFNPGLGANGTVYAVAVQPDGKILIGGDFTLVNNIQRVRIARLNADGSVDMTFDPGLGADAAVRAILVQADGSIVVGGSFTSVDSIARAYLARLDSQGMVDLSFLENVSGADNAVYALASQADGKLIVVGDFTTFNGVTRNRITRLNVNGTTDPTINFGVGANSFIAAVAIQPDRKIVIGGGFTSFDARARELFCPLARWIDCRPRCSGVQHGGIRGG